MSDWNDYAREAEKGTSWVPPVVADDLYDARINEVGDPETKPDFFNPEQLKTQFWISWELLSDDVPADTTLRQYVTIPPGLQEGYLSDKATLYAVMEALGFDMDARFEFDPRQWVDMRARVMVENKPNKDGVDVPRITGVKAPRASKPAPARQPVAAGRPPLRSRLQAEEDD